MVQQIKELRIRIDGLYQLTKELKPLSDWKDGANPEVFEYTYNSDEIEDAAKSLLLAKAWLGKLLGELGSENPYSSGKKTVEDIEPTADTGRDYIGDVPNMGTAISRKYTLSTVAELQRMNHIEKVDWLRSEIQSVIDEINSPEILHNIDNGLTWNNTYTHLCEAKMWLGQEFARIKQENS